MVRNLDKLFFENITHNKIMKKLTKQQVNYLKSVLTDMIYRFYGLRSMENHYTKINYHYDKQYKCNDLYIKVYYKLSLKSNNTTVIYYSFSNDYLMVYNKISFHKSLGCEIKNLDKYDLENVNIIVDNIKEFYNQNKETLEDD